MEREKIEQAADEFAEREYEINGVDRDYLYKGFYHGAQWRINSVWNSYSTKPDKGKLLIVEDIDSAYELVYLTKSKPWEELSEKNLYMRWAYVSDLLPEARKEVRQ